MASTAIMFDALCTLAGVTLRIVERAVWTAIGVLLRFSRCSSVFNYFCLDLFHFLTYFIEKQSIQVCKAVIKGLSNVNRRHVLNGLGYATALPVLTADNIGALMLKLSLHRDLIQIGLFRIKDGMLLCFIEALSPILTLGCDQVGLLDSVCLPACTDLRRAASGISDILLEHPSLVFLTDKGRRFGSAPLELALVLTRRFGTMMV